MLKYTIEYLEINEKMYKDLILFIPRLKGDDVYSIEMTFDIVEYRDWYDKYN